MNDKERIALANTLIEAYALRLGDIANHIGVRDYKRTVANLTGVFKDAFGDEIADALRAKERERAFVESGEAAVENKADEKRSWYREAILGNGENA